MLGSLKLERKNKMSSKTFKIITTTGEKEHSKKKTVEELKEFIIRYKNNQVDNDTIKEVVDSIVCKFVHENEIFIANDQTVWPCCFLWDSYFRNRENIQDLFKDFELNWNNLKNKNVDEILEHPWFKEILEESWNPAHPKHINRCVVTCARNKAYHNEINYDNPIDSK